MTKPSSPDDTDLPLHPSSVKAQRDCSLTHVSDFPKPPPEWSRSRAKRKIPKQATSSVAYVGPLPAEDDPLLSFAPYLHKQPRRNSITPDKQRAFIAHLAATGIVSQAARKIGRSMEALYKLRGRAGAEGFAAAWDAAVDRGVQRVEDCALERAINGVEDWRYTDGHWSSMGTKHNEALVMFFLRNRRADRYSEHIQPGHPVYERIRKEVLAEAGERVAEDLRAVLERLVTEAASTATLPPADDR